MKHPASDSERAAAQRILALFNEFRKVRPTMPLQHAYTFVLVAMNEGLGVQDYAELADVAQSVMTRNLLDLGERNRRREPGYGLLTQRMDPLDMRRHQTMLTPEGRALWRRIMHMIEK
jgi:DNA-binding MarR family transcriptional regulator